MFCLKIALVNFILLYASPLVCLNSYIFGRYMTQSEDVFLHSGIECLDCDIVLLTWQRQRPGAIFLPNSSYPQGKRPLSRPYRPLPSMVHLVGAIADEFWPLRCVIDSIYVKVPTRCFGMLWKQTHSCPPPSPCLAHGILDLTHIFESSNSHKLPCMYLYFIFVADDARLSEAFHRSHLSGTHCLSSVAPPVAYGCHMQH